MDIQKKELIKSLLVEENVLSLNSNNNQNKKQLRINREAALILTFLYPKTFTKALRLLEFCNIDIAVLNGINKQKKDNRFYKNLREVICSGNLYLIIFRKDQQLESVDDDSDNEFVIRYNSQKKYYTRNDKVYKYDYHKKNRYNVINETGNEDVKLDYIKRVCSCHRFIKEFSKREKKQVDDNSENKTQESKPNDVICEHILFIDIIILNKELIHVKPIKQQNILVFWHSGAMMNFMLENY